ncbi:hypothetical protein [Curtobacterium sp. MCBD17_040]|uniref:hypothetical protein n=1 Tax=Curtobacterium sp. MCBD17_040 TaxID=2175674 RepID=UPI000DA9897A|nr:hypothetical protein [Curtobacterium sp. MCBD17_040]WIB65412.1 hypothetical protein DEI94_18570 [Curtobacterium sp. MCBD17_040]
MPFFRQHTVVLGDPHRDAANSMFRTDFWGLLFSVDSPAGTWGRAWRAAIAAAPIAAAASALTALTIWGCCIVPTQDHRAVQAVETGCHLEDSNLSRTITGSSSGRIRINGTVNYTDSSGDTLAGWVQNNRVRFVTIDTGATICSIPDRY